MRLLLLLLTVALCLCTASAAGAEPAPDRGVSENGTDAEITGLPPVAGEYREGEVIVGFRPVPSHNYHAADSPAALAHARIGARVKTDFTPRGLEGVQVVQLPPNQTVARALAHYRGNPAVRYAEPNYERHLAYVPVDPWFKKQWGLANSGQVIDQTGTVGADIDAVRAWDITRGSTSIVVAVIDSGIDYYHPDLAANIWTNPGEIPFNKIDDDGNGYVDDIRGWDAYNFDNNPFDDRYHGTHCAGIIGAVEGNGIGISGVTPRVQLMPLKFLNKDGKGWTSGSVECILYARAKGVPIVSGSYGGGDYSQAEMDAISGTNALFVFAAGNDGTDNDVTPIYPASYTSPKIIAVAATDNRDQLASFSNYGDDSVDLAAPGVNIFSTVPGGAWGYLSGTSMAAPHVSGVAALLMAREPGLTISQVKARIISSVDHIPSLPWRTTLTSGRLNAFRALGGVAADFTCAPQSGMSPLTVKFTDTSTGTPSAWAWNFGDGQTSSTQSPSHAYANEGTYTVTLTVTYPGGTTASVAKPSLITVWQSLHAGYKVDSRIGYEPFTARFTDTTTGDPISWHWDFGDGETSDLQNPVHTYEGALSGTAQYTVKLTVSNLYETKTATKTDYIIVLPLFAGLIQTEAEDYDTGGEGVAYHDLTPGNSGGVYRSDDVDLIPSGNGDYAVSNIQAGEWTQYRVFVPGDDDATLPFRIRASAWSPNNAVRVTVNGIEPGTLLPLPNTGSGSTYGWVNSSLALAPRWNTIRLTYEGNAMNVDYFTLDPTKILVPSPDLAVLGTSGPSGTVVDRTIPVEYAVKNFGTVAAGGFTVGFYLSTDTAITTADTPVGTRPYTGLTQGNEVSDSASLTIPAAVPPGTYYFGIIVDADGVVSEGDETNNAWSARGPFTLAALPDLRGKAVTAVAGDPIVNRTFLLENAVENGGAGPAGPFTVGFYLSGDGMVTTADILIGSRNVSGLAPGAGSQATTVVTIPASVPPGTYFIGMIADSTNAVIEEDEANNLLGGNARGYALAASPDLASWSWVPPQSPITRSFTIPNAVRNIGTAPAGGFTVGFYLSTDTAITTADILIGEWVSPGLGAGAQSPLQQTPVTIPASIPAGTWYLGSIIDTTNAVTEGNELNNLASNFAPLVLSELVIPIPGGTALPRDLDLDGKFEDVNGNGRADFADVVIYFNQMSWIAANEPVSPFDYNGNSRIDFADVVWLFNHL